MSALPDAGEVLTVVGRVRPGRGGRMRPGIGALFAGYGGDVDA